MATLVIPTNRRLVLAALFLASMAIWHEASAENPSAPRAATTQPTVAELSHERVQLLRTAYEAQLKRYQRGLCSHADTFPWLRRLAKVAVDAPPSDPDRIPMLQEYVKQAADHVAETEKRIQSAVADQMEIFEARDALLEAQIWLAKAEADKPKDAGKR
ncbi:MAG TPA: hypothetical protein VLJ39_02120 [Tepidisphaeraceae bacterium]|nr:hypothetical protein [Tepidisphaeraceae bacterium]